MKRGFHFQRLLGLDFEQNDRARLVHRHAQRFAHAKGIADVQNRRGLGTNRQRSCQTLGGKRAIADVKRQVELAKNLQRIDPGFKSSRFVAEQSRASTHDRKKFPGANRARQLLRRLADLGRIAGRMETAPHSMHERTREMHERAMTDAGTNAGNESNEDSLRSSLGIGDLAAAELAKSRYPEYKK